MVISLQEEIDEELKRDEPSDAFIVSKIQDIASQLYAESSATTIIAAQIAKKRAMLMQPEDYFSCTNFSDLIESVILEETGQITLKTKARTNISEGDPDYGSD